MREDDEGVSGRSWLEAMVQMDGYRVQVDGARRVWWSEWVEAGQHTHTRLERESESGQGRECRE